MFTEISLAMLNMLISGKKTLYTPLSSQAHLKTLWPDYFHKHKIPMKKNSLAKLEENKQQRLNTQGVL